MSIPGTIPPKRRATPADLAQVAQQRVAGAGVLHLHRDLAAVGPAGLCAPGRWRRRPPGCRRTPPSCRRQPVPSSVASTWCTVVADIGERSPAAGSAAGGTGAASSSGSADSRMESAWPSFIAPPLSSPRVRKSCSAVRCCTSDSTASAGAPPDPASDSHGTPSREAEGKRSEPGRACHCLARELTHGPIVSDGPWKGPVAGPRPCPGLTPSCTRRRGAGASRGSPDGSAGGAG